MRERSQFREPDGKGVEAGQGTVEEDGLDLTTDGTENTEGKEGDEPRDEAGSGSREGGIGGRAGEGRTIPGRKRIPARGAVGGSEEGCGGEKKAASEAKLEMIKQVIAQRFSDMPAARGPRQRSQSAEGCRSGPGGERDGSMGDGSAGGEAGGDLGGAGVRGRG